MPNSTFSVLGGDLRQSYLAACLRNLGQEVTVFAVSALPDSAPCRPDPLSPDSGPARTLREALAGARVVVCPVPISKDGIYLAGTAQEASPPGNGRASADSSQVPGISLAALLEELTPGQLLVGGALPKAFREACHRFPVACRYLGRSPEEKITAEDLAVCLTSDFGQKKQVACEYRYLVNQAEELDEETREALCHLLEKGKDYGAAVSFFQKRWYNDSTIQKTEVNEEKRC